MAKNNMLGKAKRASDGRVTTVKKAIDPNPAGRTVPMANGPKKSKKNGKKVY